MQANNDANMQGRDGGGADPNDTDMAANKYRSLNDLHRYYTTVDVSLSSFPYPLQHYLLPRKRECPLSFIHAFWQGKKKFYKTNVVSAVQTPLWEELGVKHMWPIAQTIPGMMDYIPDTWDLENDGKKIQRSYFFAVFHTHSPAIMAGLIENARKQRYLRAQEKKQEKPQAVPVIPAAELERMMAADFQSSKFLPLNQLSLQSRARRTRTSSARRRSATTSCPSSPRRSTPLRDSTTSSSRWA